MAQTSVMWNSTELKKMMVVGSHLSCSQTICKQVVDSCSQFCSVYHHARCQATPCDHTVWLCPKGLDIATARRQTEDEYARLCTVLRIKCVSCYFYTPKVRLFKSTY